MCVQTGLKKGSGVMSGTYLIEAMRGLRIYIMEINACNATQSASQPSPATHPKIHGSWCGAGKKEAGAGNRQVVSIRLDLISNSFVHLLLN